MKKSLILSAALLGLTAANAYAHEIPAPTTGDTYILTEPFVNWGTNVGTSTNALIGDNTVAAYHFDVNNAGSLDIYTNDHDDTNSIASLFIYQKDAVGADWTLTNYAYEGQRTSPVSPVNIFGVHSFGYIDQTNAGTSDAGVRANFDVGSYVAFVVAANGKVFGHEGITNTPNATGAKLSAGFTWSYTGDQADLFTGIPGLSDLTIMASPGSLALVGETPAEVPVPGAVWLMGSVLAGFVGLGRKKNIAA